mgnify:CR=1 FL=1
MQRELSAFSPTASDTFLDEDESDDEVDEDEHDEDEEQDHEHLRDGPERLLLEAAVVEPQVVNVAAPRDDTLRLPIHATARIA